jgi:hypothetical protein
MTSYAINNENSDLPKEYHALMAYKRKKRDDLKADIASTSLSSKDYVPMLFVKR